MNTSTINDVNTLNNENANEQMKSISTETNDNNDESTLLSTKVLALSLLSDDAIRINDDNVVEDEETTLISSDTSIFDNYHRDTSESSSKRRVSFSCVEIRKYPIILGDNPSCQKGAPLSIDWNYFEKNDHFIDDYELERNGNRRSKCEFKVGPVARKRILKEESGVTEERIRYAIMAVNQVQQRRLESRNCKQLKWEDKKDKMIKKLKSIIKKTKANPGKNDSFNDNDFIINSSVERKSLPQFQRPNKIPRAYQRNSLPQNSISRRTV